MLPRLPNEPYRRARIAICAIIAIGGLVTVGLGAVVFTAIQTAYQEAMTHARTEVHNLAAAFADEVSLTLDQVAAGQEIIARRMRANPGHYDIYSWADEIPVIAGATIQGAIIGPDGWLISTTLDPHPKPLDLNDREHVRVHIDRPVTGMFVGRPVRGRLSNQMTLNITRRVDDATGKFIGIVMFSLSPGQLTGLGKIMDLGPRGVIVLTGLDNIIRARITRSDPTGLAGVGESIAGGERPREFPPNAEGFYSKSGAVDGVWRLLAYRRLGDRPLVATVGLDLDNVLAVPRAAAAILVSIAAVSTLIMIALGIYLIREIRLRTTHAIELADERTKLGVSNQALQDDIVRRGEVERQLRDAQEMLIDAVESISEAFVIFGPDDRLVLCNEAYRRLYAHAGEFLVPGVAFETLLRAGLAAGRHASAVGREEEWIAERLRAHRNPSSAFEQQLTNGQYLLITDRQMRNGGTAGLRIDITELKKTEAKLREMMESLDRVQRIAGIGSIEVDAATDHVTWSAGACTIFGISPEAAEPTLKFVLGFVHPDDRDLVTDAIAAIQASGVAAPALEYRIIRPDGTERVVYRDNAVRVDDSGKPVGRIVTFKDITELKKAETRLREMMDNLDRAQRLAHMGSYTRDLRTDHSQWSAEMCRIFGVDPETFVPSSENFMRFVLPEDGAKILATNEQAMLGITPDEFEYRIRRSDGAIRHIHRITELIRDRSGKVIGLGGTIWDVTELRAAQERQKDLERQLQHSQKLEALGTLAGGVAHDLNNALMPILALTKMMRDELAEDDPQREEMTMIVTASQRARDLVKQILAFSRKEEIRKTVIDPAGVVIESLQMPRATLPPNITIIEQIGECRPILADPGQLQQVIVNLVTNAAQAIGSAEGSVTVRLELGHSAAAEGGRERVEICVSDTGCGIGEDVLGRIFEPFFTTKGVGEGTGLGLAVVHGIVTAHGGTIAVASEIRIGTTFTISLPAAAPAVAPLETLAA